MNAPDVSRKIVIEVMPDGVTKIDAQGFQGQGCSLATRELELVLAGNAGGVDKRPKPDFFAEVGQSNMNTN